MHLIAPKLWVGSQADFEELDQCGTEWSIVHAARDPWHRKELGYTGRGAPPDHPEYLFARRGKRLLLNLVDAADPKYISAAAVGEAMRFIDEQRAACLRPDDHNAVLVCCNQGQSRAPTVGMLFLAPTLPEDFEEAEENYRVLCPSYAPGIGMREFARQHWRVFRIRGTIIELTNGMEVPMGLASDTALDKAERIWHRLCETMKSDPALARDQLIRELVQAYSAAEKQERLTHGQDRTSSPPG